jgi:hypothetical protein
VRLATCHVPRALGERAEGSKRVARALVSKPEQMLSEIAAAPAPATRVFLDGD